MANFSWSSKIFLLEVSFGCMTVADDSFTLSRNPNDIHFYFFSDPEDVNATNEIIYNDTASLLASGFQANRKTIFITHGFRSNLSSDMPQTMKNAFLKANAELGLDHNIVVTSWGALSTPLPPEKTGELYSEVVPNVPIVARRLADLVLFIRENNLLELSNVNLVGHSLGSHISGLAGRNIYLATGQKVPRVTGLDPAGPNFFPPSPEKNLNIMDAEFVDAIHTDRGVLGDLTNDGHADFYPNGGIEQPNCTQGDWGNVAFLGRCSHWYAYQLYAKSLFETFLACPCALAPVRSLVGLCPTTCSNPVRIGFFCSPKARGEYYLKAPNPL